MDSQIASIAPPPAGAIPEDRRPRRSTAEYRWTQPKVLAFLAALARCGRVTEAARAVGMSGTSAYRLRARMGSARFDAAFEGARRSGILARAEASRTRARAIAAAARSPWEGPGIAEMALNERAFALRAQGAAVPPQDVPSHPQGAARLPQGAIPPRQGAADMAQGAATAYKVPENCSRTV